MVQQNNYFFDEQKWIITMYKQKIKRGFGKNIHSCVGVYEMEVNASKNVLEEDSKKMSWTRRKSILEVLDVAR